jgi:hypothetical protein
MAANNLEEGASNWRANQSTLASIVEDFKHMFVYFLGTIASLILLYMIFHAMGLPPITLDIGALHMVLK